MVNKSLLKNVYLFKDFTNDELTPILELMTEDSFNNGTQIFSQGDQPKSIFIIKMGSVKISRGSKADDVEVENLGTGAHFGESSCLDGGKRFVTATAMEHTEVISIDFAALNKVLMQNPQIGLKFYKNLAKFLSGKFRVSTESLGLARERDIAS